MLYTSSNCLPMFERTIIKMNCTNQQAKLKKEQTERQVYLVPISSNMLRAASMG